MGRRFCRHSICHLVFSCYRRSSQCCRRSHQSPANHADWFWFRHTTLVILCVLTFVSSIGVAGWEAIVYKADGNTSDSPLPLALSHIVGNNNVLYHLLITIGLFGLIASFHGIILAAGRSSFEFGRVRFAPAFLEKFIPDFKHRPMHCW